MRNEFCSFSDVPSRHARSKMDRKNGQNSEPVERDQKQRVSSAIWRSEPADLAIANAFYNSDNFHRVCFDDRHAPEAVRNGGEWESVRRCFDFNSISVFVQ